MKRYRKKSVIEDEIYEVTCNMCGEEIKKDEFGNFFEYLTVEKNWGYLSKLDGKIHEFDLCDNCYKNIIKNFKIQI